MLCLTLRNLQFNPPISVDEPPSKEELTNVRAKWKKLVALYPQLCIVLRQQPKRKEPSCAQSQTQKCPLSPTTEYHNSDDRKTADGIENAFVGCLEYRPSGYCGTCQCRPCTISATAFCLIGLFAESICRHVYRDLSVSTHGAKWNKSSFTIPVSTPYVRELHAASMSPSDASATLSLP